MMHELNKLQRDSMCWLYWPKLRLCRYVVSDGGGAPGGGDDGDVLMLMVNMARGDQSLTSHNYHHPHPSPLVRIESV